MTRVPPRWPFAAVEVEDFDYDRLEGVRRVRNECREFMTENQDHIDEETQRRWWSRRSLNIRLFAFYGGASFFQLPSGIIGYGLLRPRESNSSSVWLSGGLLTPARGRGLGTALFGHLVHEALAQGSAPFLVVWERNRRALRTYERLGFEPWHARETGKLEMRWSLR